MQSLIIVHKQLKSTDFFLKYQNLEKLIVENELIDPFHIQSMYSIFNTMEHPGSIFFKTYF